MLDEDQLKQDWAAVLALADQTGRSLEQIHIFSLAHILRRPIIVYGVRVVKNYLGENLGFANFEGMYIHVCIYIKWGRQHSLLTLHGYTCGNIT